MVFLISHGLVHPGPRARRRLAQLFADQGTPLLRAGRLERLPDLLAQEPAGEDPAGAADPPGLVLFFHHKREPVLDPQVMSALERHLTRGGRVLALHATTASFKHDERYAAYLGGRFVGHDRVKPFVVEPLIGWGVDALRNCPEPYLVRDERYHHHLADDVLVVARSHGEPVVWLRREGRGELCYLAFGHRPDVFDSCVAASLITAAATRLFGPEERGS